MLHFRRAQDRGHFDFGWLKTYHTFSFGDYHDPNFMGFRTLRVINEDTVQPGKGFETHPHRDMEIITCVLAGALEHKDSMGNGSVIRPGEVQRMSAGTGVTHSESNHSKKEPVHLYQIWILPEKKGLPPSYEQKKFSSDEKKGQFRLIASQESKEGSVSIHQDVNLYASILQPGEKLEWIPHSGRHVWLQIARGGTDLNGTLLRDGDGASVSEELPLTIRAEKECEILLFDLK